MRHNHDRQKVLSRLIVQLRNLGHTLTKKIVGHSARDGIRLIN